MANSERWAEVNNRFAGLTLVGVMLVGFWQANLSLRSEGALDIPVSIKDLRDGTSTAAFGRNLDRYLPLRESLIATANVGRYLVVHGAGDQVRLGRRDWLFLADELRYDAKSEHHLALRLATVRQAHLGLRRMGVELLVVLVPDKARIYADHLPEKDYPKWNQARYTQALGGLADAGVPVVDLRPVLTSESSGPSTYYRTDTHWNQLGARLVAQAVASQAQLLGLTLPETPFKTLQEGKEFERVGDLLRMMGLTNVPNVLRPDPDLEAPVITQSLRSAPQTLLGDAPTVPVVLAGTSYSLRGNFHGYLQQALQVQVLNTARDGGGFIQSINDYLADESFALSKPKLLIWEIPERVLTGPLGPHEQAGLVLP